MESPRCDSKLGHLAHITPLNCIITLALLFQGSTHEKSGPERRESASERGLSENDERDDDYGKGNENLQQTSQRLQRQAVPLVVESHAHLHFRHCRKKGLHHLIKPGGRLLHILLAFTKDTWVRNSKPLLARSSRLSLRMRSYR